MGNRPSSKRLPKGVLLLSYASFFTDVATEAVYPIMPVFLTTTLGASPFSIGLIEGIAESTASLLKAVFGAWSDRIGKKKIFVVLGYSFSNLIKPLMAFVNSWTQVLGIRFLDRTGKGIRTAPRDAMLAQFSDKKDYARVYGFHRGMDHAGAVTGPLLAAVFLYFYPQSFRSLFLLTFIPGTIAVLLLLMLGEKSNEEKLEAAKIEWKEAWSQLPPTLKKYFVLLFIFSLGNSTDAFLLLRLKNGGLSAEMIPVMWALLHIVKMSVSFLSAKVSDQFGLKKTIAMGWILFTAIYFSFSFPLPKFYLLSLFLVYGLFFGLTEGSERALVAKLSPTQLKGSHFGIYSMTVGLSALPASLLFGYLWQVGGMQLAFIVGAGFAAIAAILLSFLKVQP